MSEIIPNERGMYNNDERAVSPVIGVILMVAITVILAAVIGAFVLEIGDQQETAPNTSFTTSEEPQTAVDNGGTIGNYTRVNIGHAGGDNIDVTKLTFQVEEYPGAIGVRDESTLSDDTTDIDATWYPDPRESLGSNEQVEFSAGEEGNIFMYGGREPEIAAADYRGTNDRSGVNAVNFMWDNFYLNAGDHCIRTGRGGSNDDLSQSSVSAWAIWTLEQRDAGEPPGDESGNNCLDSGDHQKNTAFILNQGDTVSVVWEASSGGKTQQLQKYTVQNTFPDPCTNCG